MILVPAPNLPAFADKLDLLFAHGIELKAVDDDWRAAMRADAERLVRHV